MILYFDFEGIRMNADVDWPEDANTIYVTLTDKRLIRDFPPDLIYDLSRSNKITFHLENPSNKRLTELQKIIGRRLQEITGQM